MCGSYCLSGFSIFSSSCGQLLAHHCHLPSFTSIHLSCYICLRPAICVHLTFWSAKQSKMKPYGVDIALIRCVALHYINQPRATAGDRPSPHTLCHIFTGRIMVSTLPGAASRLIAAILTSASWNSSGEVSKELPAVCGACVLAYEARVWDGGLAGVVYFQRVVLRMCWEVEELRELSALWFGFHLPETQLGGLG